MKNLLLSIFLLLSINSFSQKVTYKDLIGTSWILNDTTESLVMGLKFVDSSHLIQTFSAPKVNMSVSDTPNYLLDLSYNPVLIHITGVSGEQRKINYMWLVKIDGNILKFQGDESGEIPAKWIDKETIQNTATMSKVK
ncbi:MAG TPA: hypothetical protein VK718_05810 [Ferruginibacter sp.]|jgi:hypothetical protein|nr:hypothetical protein [Ferruginibacter sp.]